LFFLVKNDLHLSTKDKGIDLYAKYIINHIPPVIN